MPDANSGRQGGGWRAASTAFISENCRRDPRRGVLGLLWGWCSVSGLMSDPSGADLLTYSDTSILMIRGKRP